MSFVLVQSTESLSTQEYKLRAWIRATAQIQTLPNYLQPLSLNDLNCAVTNYMNLQHKDVDV